MELVLISNNQVRLGQESVREALDNDAKNIACVLSRKYGYAMDNREILEALTDALSVNVRKG